MFDGWWKFPMSNVGRNMSHTKKSTAFGDSHIWFQLLQTTHHFQIWRFCSFLSNNLQFNFTGLALIFLFAQSNFAPSNYNCVQLFSQSNKFLTYSASVLSQTCPVWPCNGQWDTKKILIKFGNVSCAKNNWHFPWIFLW